MEGNGAKRLGTTWRHRLARGRSAPLAAAVAAIVVFASALTGSSAASSVRTVGGRPIVGGAHAYVAGELLVRFRGDVSDAAVGRLNASLGATTLRSYHTVPNLRP